MMPILPDVLTLAPSLDLSVLNVFLPNIVQTVLIFLTINWGWIKEKWLSGPSSEDRPTHYHQDRAETLWASFRKMQKTKTLHVNEEGQKRLPSCQKYLFPTISCRKLQEPLSGGFDQPSPNANQLYLTLELIPSHLEKLSQRLLRQVGLRPQGLLISEIGIGHHYGVGAVHFLGSWGHSAISGQCRSHWNDCHFSCSRWGRCVGCTMRPPLWLRWSPRVPASPWLVIKHGYSMVSYILVARARLRY